MCAIPTFEDFLNRLRQGEPEVVQHFQQFGRRLIRLAHSRLDFRLRSKEDPEDVVQSVFRSFLLRHDQGKYQLSGWDDLWSLLTVITLRKCFRRVEHYLTQRRDVQREVTTSAEDSGFDWQGVAREPTPEEAAILAETVEGLFRGLDAEDRQAVEMALQGFKAAEISQQQRRAERAVYRVLERLRGQLQRQRDALTP